MIGIWISVIICNCLSVSEVWYNLVNDPDEEARSSDVR